MTEKARFTRQRRMSLWRSIALHTWPDPADPSVYGTIDLDVTAARRHIERLRETTGVKVTLTHLVGKAVALAIAERPEVNAIVRRGRQVYLRDSIDVFFQVATDGGEDLSGMKIAHADAKSVVEIAAEMAERVERVRSKKADIVKANERLGRLPSVIRGAMLHLGSYLSYDLGVDLSGAGLPWDQFGSAMVTNVGSFGLPVGFAPLVPFARTPILLTVGTVEDRPVAVEGRLEVRPMMTIGATFDHRLLDGYKAGRLARRFRAAMLDPETHLPAPAAGALPARSEAAPK